MVKHDAKVTKQGHPGGTYVQVKHTYSCVNGSRVTWPQEMPANHGTWTRWYDVPVGTEIPNTSDDRACVHTPPATAPHPATRLEEVLATSLTGTWDRAATSTTSATCRRCCRSSTQRSTDGPMRGSTTGEATPPDFTKLTRDTTG